MAMNRANMASQVMKPPMKKKLKKDAIGLKHGGSCRGMGAAKKGGKFTVS